MESRCAGIRGRRGAGFIAWTLIVCASVVGALLDGTRTRPVDDPIGAVHREMLDRLNLGDVEQIGNQAVCFAPGTSDDVIAAFRTAMARLNPDRFQQTGRWSGGTAMGSTGSENQPITLTYSFAPDGTLIPSSVGEPTAASNLFAWLNGIYGSPATWQALFQQVFDRWGELSGVNVVYEPNDDGAAFFGNQGQLGVRGDIRIGGKFIDGTPVGGSVLAYAQFPNTGDIVFDTSDAYFQVTTSNSRRLRNVASHEVGHTLGMLHVCPVLSEKLMEPITSVAYDGPRHDDIRNAQDFYGDIFEPNEAAVSAKNIGVVAEGETLDPGAIVDPTVPNASALSLNEMDSSPFTNDVDWYRFSTDGKVDLMITVSPVGLTYQDNPQSCPSQPQDCCSGATTDSLQLADLSIQLLDSSGFLVLATAASNGLGQPEQIMWSTDQSETFDLRVYTSTQGFYEPQMYSLEIAAPPPPEPGPFALVAPLNGATDIETGPVLDWADSAGADTYLVEVDSDVTFASPDVSQVVAAPTTVLDLADATLAYDTQYYWRVTATNAFGDTVSTPSLSGFHTGVSSSCPCVGDIDGDCDTDVFDFGIFVLHFGSGVAPGTNGDLNDDGVVDIFDFGIFVLDFHCPP